MRFVGGVGGTLALDQDRRVAFSGSGCIVMRRLSTTWSGLDRRVNASRSITASPIERWSAVSWCAGTPPTLP